MRCKPTHPSPSARQFRLLLNDLATPALRRMFCSEEGACVRFPSMPRTREDTDKIFCDAEWQADTFAGTLLMSPRHLGKFSDPDDAARQCGITGAAAKVMWAKYLAEDCFPRAAENAAFCLVGMEMPLENV